MKWKRTSDRKAGPANLLNERWRVEGKGGYWSVTDEQTGKWWPGPGRGYSTMKYARQVAEYLAEQEEKHER